MSSPPPLGEFAEVLPTDTPERFAAAVARVVTRLQAGDVVALPTETVYGLAANALDPAAVRRVYAIKGRPSHNPLIVHAASRDMVRACVRAWPPEADRLSTAFWPGPLTMVLPRTPQIPDEVTAGGDTVGVRWPAHPFMQAVIRACGFPLAAPSANRANETSPTNAAHVLASLGEGVSLIVDGGPAHVGIESTVIDLTEHPPRLLRAGMIHEESLAAVLGGKAEMGISEERYRSPGQSPRHYAPRASLSVLTWRNEDELKEAFRVRGIDPQQTHVLAHEHIPGPSIAARVCVIPHDPEAYARAMFAEWHRADELGARWIVVETVPGSVEWQGIRDRLRRAGAPAPMAGQEFQTGK